QSRHDRLRGGFIAPGLHDLQLANTRRSDASPGETVARSRRGGATHDISRFILVDDLCLPRIRQLVDCPGEAAARARIRRRAWDNGGVDLRVRDVSAVPG